MTARLAALLAAAAFVGTAAPRGYVDREHRSAVFGETRHYRLFLPAAYARDPQARFPVIYYFHGHSDRYTLEKYDNGQDTVPKIERFVAAHPVIVVAVDGYVAKDYTGFYGGAPWDVYETGGAMDFGAYFRELTAHIDSTLRTRRDRRHRATSGLSMGGFMSLYLSARYPDLIGSASSFNPGPEFFTGEPGRRMLWRPKDHVSSHTGTMVRLIRASGDYISQYHEETHEAYASAAGVDYEYRRDEYHRHWATSIAETFAFHLRAFANAALDRAPERWSYTCAYRDCEAWGYRIRVDSPGACFVYLDGVSASHLGVRTRAWAPDGPPCANTTVRIATSAGRYAPASRHRVRSLSRAADAEADAQGRLTFTARGDGEIITVDAREPFLLPLSNSDYLRVEPDAVTSLPVRLYNPTDSPLLDVPVTLSSEYPTVQVVSPATVRAPRIEPGAVADVPVRARFVSGDGYYARARLQFAVGAARPVSQDVLIAPTAIPAPWEWEVLDGRTRTYTVFRQKGNQGGGGPIPRTVTEGTGNGNGILEPGERATIWVRLKQGIDPFDKGNWYRAKVRADSPCAAEAADLREQKQLEWTGAKERTSLIEWSCQPSTPVTLTLDHESWSYAFTPDVRYGRELLYQAFQRHRRHLWRVTLP